MNIPLGKWSGSDSTDALHSSIKEFNAQSGRQTQQMLRLTWVMAVLTGVMLLGLLIQIYLVFYPPPVQSSAVTQSAALGEPAKPGSTAQPAKTTSAITR